MIDYTVKNPSPVFPILQIALSEDSKRGEGSVFRGLATPHPSQRSQKIGTPN